MTALYQPGIDLGAVSAIDVHVHVEQDEHGHLALDDELMAASAGYFRSTESRTPTVDSIAACYREAGMAAVIFTVDATTNTGHPALSSERIAEIAARHADVLVPFGSVDPRQGAPAVQRARRLVTEYGVRGFKFHPSLQGFSPDDPEFSPLWAAIEELRVPALFHTGQNGIGAGLPGGRGIKLRYSNPILLDDVAADFPGLTVILAHPSVPWQAEAISMATHKANVYIDLSGWRPKYFPPELVRAAGGLLRGKVLFGTDYPLITPERWLADFAALGIDPTLHQAILKDTTAGLLGLGVSPDRTGSHPPTLLYLLKQLELRVRSHLDELVRPAGLTALQYTALTVLEGHPDLTSARLARRSFVSAQSMADMVKALLDRELIQRHDDPTDRRRLVLALTAQGRELLDRFRGPVADLEGRMLSGLTSAQAAQLRRAILSCHQALTD